MKTIQSRIYTNVILTVIAIFLGALALQPVLSISTQAFAQRTSDRNLQQRRAYEQKQGAPAENLAKATHEVAAATRGVAQATQASADALAQIAKAIEKASMK